MMVPASGMSGGNRFGIMFLGVANSQMGVTFSGLARAIFDESLKFAMKENGGSAPFDQENVRLRLFNMFAATEAAHLFSHRVVGFQRGGANNPIAKAITALFTSTRATFWVASQGIQIFMKLYKKYHDHEKVLAFMEKRARKGRPNPLAEWGKYGIASKIICTETAFNNGSEAMKIFGQAGQSTDHPIEKMFRDARTGMIEDGVNESLALAAAESLPE
jgi:alkylation response protein AidB-like acyl-CoA dehydrogenase